MDKSILGRIRDVGIVPVIKLEDSSKAVPLAGALCEGGIGVAEVTFRAGSAPESIGHIREALPEMLVGAGTVTSVAQARAAKDAGAHFVVSPGFNDEVVDFCLSEDLAVLPGVNNPDGVERGLARGLDVLKFFPAEASGGVAMLDALAGPYQTVSFVPTGGVGLANIGNYARRATVWAVGGSWMVDQGAIAAGDWQTIARLSREAVLALHGFAIAHFGINMKDECEASALIRVFGDVFGIAALEGSASYMVGGALEVTKKPFPGASGHIAIHVNDVDRAVAYLAPRGYAAAMETAKREKGRLKSVYVGRLNGDFAIHLLGA